MWKEIKKNISFSPRRGHAVIEYKDHVYVLGGEQCKGGDGNVCEQDENAMPIVQQLSDVWFTKDLIQWNISTPNANFGPRAFHAAVVFQDAMWIFGGGSSDCKYQVENNITVHLCQDAWFSSDSKTWTAIVSNHKETWWYPRIGHSVAVFENRVWIFG